MLFNRMHKWSNGWGRGVYGGEPPLATLLGDRAAYPYGKLAECRNSRSYLNRLINGMSIGTL